MSPTCFAPTARRAIHSPSGNGIKLEAIDRCLRKRPSRDAGAIERRIGHWLGRYTGAETMVEVTVIRDARGHAIGLEIRRKECPAAARTFATALPLLFPDGRFEVDDASRALAIGLEPGMSHLEQSA
jgi:hypothetical protein